MNHACRDTPLSAAADDDDSSHASLYRVSLLMGTMHLGFLPFTDIYSGFHLVFNGFSDPTRNCGGFSDGSRHDREPRLFTPGATPRRNNDSETSIPFTQRHIITGQANAFPSRLRLCMLDLHAAIPILKSFSLTLSGWTSIAFSKAV
jgi:hypothetical protein